MGRFVPGVLASKRENRIMEDNHELIRKVRMIAIDRDTTLAALITLLHEQ